ncbi:hypothetical protein [Mesorhizobium sp.]|uniref:hypothetical protein n=1 Tax=Mesorhizobium sp. TaxID=1871066 RepID=UPI00257D9DF9|nr:hypothetical protein [Mesorhizobium sp.]
MLAVRSPAALASVFAVAVFKSRLIVLDFMGFRSAPLVLRHALVAWSLGLAFAALGKLLVS